MVQRFVNFLRALSMNWLGSIAVAMTTTAFVLFIFVELLRILGIVTSSYVGLITYLALPALFILGLILVPFAWRQLRRASGKTTKELLEERFEPDELKGKAYGSRLVRMFFILTLATSSSWARARRACSTSWSRRNSAAPRATA